MYYTIIKILLIFGCTIYSAFAAERLYQNAPSVTPELAKSGKWPVGVSTVKVINPDQLNVSDFTSRYDRELTLEMWYPAANAKGSKIAEYRNVTRTRKPFAIQGNAYRDAGVLQGKRFPVVVISHGYPGYRTMMYYLGEHLASHGYIVAGIDHTDSTNQDIDVVASPFSGFLSTLYNRSRDQQFVLEYLTQHAHQFSNIVDKTSASIIGYSMGGYGAINTTGGCFNFTQETLVRFGVPEAAASQILPVMNSCNAGKSEPDKRWKAMVAMAPWGQELNLHASASLTNHKLPSLYMSGDQDDISGYEYGVKKLYEQSGARDKYLLVFQTARHNIAAHPAPKIAYAADIDIGHYLESSWSNQSLNRLSRHIILAFLDCHVKSSNERCSMLPEAGNITQRKLPDGTLTPAWPGFPDRWGTGVEFKRAVSK